MHQIPLIEAAKKLGFKVIGVDQNLSAPGMEHCDLAVQESLTNYRKIKYQIDMFMLDAEIAGVFSASFGEALISWSYLAEQYGCVGPSRTLIERLIDKYETRKMLEGVEKKCEFFAQPPYHVVPGKIHRQDIENIGFPLIVKTRSGHGKNHVYEVDNLASLKELFAKSTLQKLNIDPRDLMIEKKIEGDEITVVGLVQNFKYHLISITDKVTSKKAPFIELLHRYPSGCHDRRGEVEAMHQEIVSAIELPDAPLVSEWKLRSGKYYLVEMSPQIPGEFLGSFLIPSALKYPYFRNLVRVLVGRNVEEVKPDKKTKAGTIQYYTDVMSDSEWRKIERSSPFSKILNPKPHRPARNNSDRYAVVGRIG